MVDDHDLVPENDDMLNNAPTDDDYALLSDEDFDDVLQALGDDEFVESEDSESSDDFEGDTQDDTAVDDDDVYNMAEAEDSSDEFGENVGDEPETVDDDERLRGPRAQQFRRHRLNRIAFLPLALYLVALGGFLIAREQAVEGLPDFSRLVIGSVSVLVAAFTMIFHALLSGRRERGLLVIGLWIGATTGLIAALVYGIDDQPNAVEWWPLLLGALALTLLVNYIVERTHDARLIWLGILCFVTAGVAYAFTSDTIDEEAFNEIADYWPLLISVVGIGIVPLIFRRRLE